MDIGPVTFASAALDPDSLRLLSLSGREGLNELYSYRLELVAPRPVDVQALLGSSARVEIPTPQGVRVLAGVLSELVVEPKAVGVGYTVTLIPRVAALRERVQSRSLRGASVIGLARHLLGELGLVEGADFSFSPALLKAEAQRPRRTRARLPELEEIVQRAESDYALLTRWLEREGVGFRFEANAFGLERLVFFDGAPESCRETSSDEVRVLRAIHKTLPREVVVTQSGQHALEECAAAVAPQGVTRVEADAAWRTRGQAQTLANLWSEELRGWAEVMEALVETPSLSPGDVFGADRAARRVVSVTHTIQQTPGLAGWSYEGRLEALQAEFPFRPARRSPVALPVSRCGTPRAKAAQPKERPQPSLVGAGPRLPQPGFGSSNDPPGAAADGDDSERGVGVGASDGTDLWSQWLTDYQAIPAADAASAGIELKSTADLTAAIQEVLPSGVAFADFENACTSFDGSFGGSYEVSVGDQAEVALGSAGSYAKGQHSIEVSDFASVNSKSTVGTLTEDTTITGGSTATTDITGDTSETTTQTGNATSSSTVTGNVSETSAVTGNVTEASTVNGNVTETPAVTGNVTENSTVGGNVTETSTVTGSVTETSTVLGDVTETAIISGDLKSKTTVTKQTETTVAQQLENRTSTLTQVELGAYLARFGAEASVIDVNLLAQAVSVDINLVIAKLDVLIGIWCEIKIGLGLDVSIGNIMDIAIGARTEICTGAATEVDLSDTTVTLTGFDKALAKFLGLP